MTLTGALPITGYSLCNCLGRTTLEVIEALCASRSGLTDPPFPLTFKTKCGTVPELPPLPRKFAAYEARQARIAVQTLEPMRPALKTAIRRWGADRVAVVMATSTGGISASEEAYDTYKATRRLPPSYDYARQHVFHAFTELIRTLIGAEGPSYVISTACSSSGKVLASARRLIGAGAADAVLVGGVDSLARTTLCGFAGLSVLSPAGCRPFDPDRQGMSIGEGGAMLLVEREGDACAMLLGAGESSDAHHMSSPHPDGLGARLAIERALADAGMDCTAVDYINAHGTGTRLNDAAEAQAIAALFGRSVPVVSTKGFTGHLLGAAGATEAIFTVIALEQGWIPANLGAERADPELPIWVNLQRMERACRVALSNSFGFGGSNVAVLLGEA